MALYTKCLTCGGWKGAPANPVAEDQIPTGMMMHRAEPPSNLCTCDGGQRKDAE